MSKATRQGPYKNRLKEFREEVVKITQSELANRLKKRGFRVSESYLSQIEAGLKHIPYGLAIALCEELGYSSDKVTEIFLPCSFTGSQEKEGSTTPTLLAAGDQ